ncbi:MAG: hypothetical protein IPG00_03085 [Saprospiraceae bacterium]|nr:hypothetical protein [Saprospiraceae bacterium]
MFLTDTLTDDPHNYRQGHAILTSNTWKVDRMNLDHYEDSDVEPEACVPNATRLFVLRAYSQLTLNTAVLSGDDSW